jgi:hypothetical protein
MMMSSQPVWQAEGWRGDGPGYCRCPGCGTKVSTNAYARRAHAKKCAAWSRIEIRAVPQKGGS